MLRLPRARWFAALLLCAPITAGAQSLEKKLAGYELEARQIGTNLPEPGRPTVAGGQRRLVDAEVAFSLGDYDSAALMLYDLASRPGPDRLRALYYLGESLFQKGDKGAARTYFEQIGAQDNAASKYYQPALLRLVEIAIAQRDNSSVDKQFALLDAVPLASRLPQVSYVRGKYAYSQDKLDDALRFYGEVPRGSSHEYQAAYYIGTTHVAKKDYVRATDVFTELIQRKPKLPNDRRVIELAQLALGRMYYERDQLSKSIDHYLLIDRRSDLFPDALYEVAWVYVKGKQYDKALRALELLSLSAPTSQKTPTVRILEGNLRIRKAQMLRQKQIAGTIEKDGVGEPTVEYDKASQVFAETHEMYKPSYDALTRMVDSPGDPAQYLAQIAGRSPTIFQATAPLPEAAAAYLREEPEVQRVVAVETDLAAIESNLADSEGIIARLEGVLATNDRNAVYPALQSRRSRIAHIQDELIRFRNELAEEQLKLVEGGQLAGAAGARKAAVQQYLAMPNAEQAHADRVAQAQAQYDAIDQATAEVNATIDATQAVAVALRKYSIDAAPPLPADQQRAVGTTLEASAKEAAAIEKELAAIQREILLGRDLAGVGDEAIAKARDARAQVKVALDAEQRGLASAAGASSDRGKSQKLVALGDRAQRLSESLSQTEKEIDSIIGRGMDGVKRTLATERQNVAAYKAELTTHEAESRAIGGTVLGASFRDVKARFYDIVIRTDVGSVDVSWSQKEDSDDDLKRLNLSRQRDLKQLRDEFKGIVEEGARKPAPNAPPPPIEGGPTGSPDKGGVDPQGRIKPGTEKDVKAPAPTVRPDNEQKLDPKGAPKKDPKAPKADPKAPKVDPKAPGPAARGTGTPASTLPPATRPGTPKTGAAAGTAPKGGAQ